MFTFADDELVCAKGDLYVREFYQNKKPQVAGC